MVIIICVIYIYIFFLFFIFYFLFFLIYLLFIFPSSNGRLTEVKFSTVHLGVDLSVVEKVNTGLLTSQLAKQMNRKEVHDLIVDAWIEKAKDSRKSTLVFCVDTTHVRDLTSRFRERGIDARYATAQTNSRIRAELVDAFRNGEFPVFLNCALFTEGTDIPNIDCIMLARPTTSMTMLIQMIGRGTRLYEGKKDCHVLDFIAIGRDDLVATPTLHGLPLDIAFDEKTDSELSELADEIERERLLKEQEKLIEKLKELRMIEEEMTEDERNEERERKLLRELEIERLEKFLEYTEWDLFSTGIPEIPTSPVQGDNIFQALHQSMLSWVNIGNDKFVLNFPNGNFLKIYYDYKNNMYKCDEVTFMTKYETNEKTYTTTKVVLHGSPNFVFILKGADKFALRKASLAFLSRKAPWRLKEATPKQMKIALRMFKGNTPENITRGSVADAITRYKNGHKKYLDEKKKALQVEKKKKASEAKKKELEAKKIAKKMAKKMAKKNGKKNYIYTV